MIEGPLTQKILANLGTANAIPEEEEIAHLTEVAQRKVIETARDALGRLRDPKAKETIRRVVTEVVRQQALGRFAEGTIRILADRITNEISGYGPIDPFLDDPEVSGILVEHWNQILVDRRGRFEEASATFRSEKHLRQVIDRMIALVPGDAGRRLDLSSPIVDARLPDGSRINAVIPPTSVDGATLTVRKFRADIDMAKLVEYGVLPERLAWWLAELVRGHINIVISGATAAGKTTFLNALSEFFDPLEPVITIENPAELQLKHKHVRRLEARPANLEGNGEITQLALVQNTLRMQPTRIIVGECRGPEAYPMLQAMISGHTGSFTTVHAENARKAIMRLISMASQSGEVTKDLVPDLIGQAIEVIVQLLQMKDGRRRLVEIAQVRHEDDGSIEVETLLTWSQEKQMWIPTGIPFRYQEALESRGGKRVPELQELLGEGVAG